MFRIIAAAQLRRQARRHIRAPAKAHAGRAVQSRREQRQRHAYGESNRRAAKVHAAEFARLGEYRARDSRRCKPKRDKRARSRAPTRRVSPLARE